MGRGKERDQLGVASVFQALRRERPSLMVGRRCDSFSYTKQVKFFKVSDLEDHPALLSYSHLTAGDGFSKNLIHSLHFVRDPKRSHALPTFIPYFFSLWERKLIL